MTELGSNMIPKESEYNFYRESYSYRTTNNNTLIPQTKLGQLLEIRYIYELKGLFFTNPLLSLSLCISLFSMAGLPPLIGFFSKQFVLYSALQNGYYFISLIAIIVSVISASYYLKIIKILHTDHDYFEDKLLEWAVEANKAPNQSNVLLNEDKEFKEFKKVKEFKEGAKAGMMEGESLTAEIPIVTLNLKEPLVHLRNELLPVACGLVPVARSAKARADAKSNCVRLQETFACAGKAQGQKGKKMKVGVESRVGISLNPMINPILLNLEQNKTTLTNTHSFLISSLTLIILLFFIKPSIILNSTQLLSLSLFYI